MAFWSAKEITKAHLVKDLEWLNETHFGILVEHTTKGFVVTISKKSGGSISVKMFEQSGCCGAANIEYPSSYGTQNWVKGKTRGDLYVQVMHAMAHRVCASVVYFIGTKLDWVFDSFKRYGWKKVHEMPNRRYGATGSMLYSWEKNFNTFRTVKGVKTPIYPRNKHDPYV